MADQNAIDRVSLLISDLIDRARKELVDDLVTLGYDIRNNEAFVTALNQLDIADTLRKKISKASNSYVAAHRQVLESTIGFAEVKASTLTSFISLNQQVLDNTVINTVAAHIRNEVAKGVLAGVPAEFIAEAVARASISTSQIETLINTTLNSYSRTITNTMMEVAPKKTKYVYIGPVDDRTRDECLEYAGSGPITEAEIIGNGWEASLVDGGGFNCRHKWEIASTEGKGFSEQDKVSQQRVDNA